MPTYIPAQQYWQNLIKIIIWSWSPWNSHSIWRFLHWSHYFIWNPFNNNNILCKGRNEPIDIKNVGKVTASNILVYKKYSMLHVKCIGYSYWKITCGIVTYCFKNSLQNAYLVSFQNEWWSNSGITSVALRIRATTTASVIWMYGKVSTMW